MTKKKIVVKGPKVQNVGYRPFLLDMAYSESLPNFDAKNKRGIDKDGNQTVEVLIGVDDEAVKMFIEFIKDGVKNSDNKPEKAIVIYIEVVDEDYKGNIRTTDSYSRWLANDQLSKMVGVGLNMLGKQDDTIKEVRNGFDNMTKKQDETIKEIRNGFDNMTNKQGETIEEIGNMRDDLKSYFDSRITKLEKDVFQIKKKIKIIQ